jgi:hypothetical protein
MSAQGTSCDICVTCYTIHDAHVFSAYILCMGDYKTMNVTSFGYCEKHVWKIVEAFHNHSLRPNHGEYTDEILMKKWGEHNATYL